MGKNELIEQLRTELPPVWDRKNTTVLTGGVINARSLANLMCLGQGPKDTYRIGPKKVVIRRDSFLEWLSERLEINEGAA